MRCTSGKERGKEHGKARGATWGMRAFFLFVAITSASWMFTRRPFILFERAWESATRHAPALRATTPPSAGGGHASPAEFAGEVAGDSDVSDDSGDSSDSDSGLPAEVPAAAELLSQIAGGEAEAYTASAAMRHIAAEERPGAVAALRRLIATSPHAYTRGAAISALDHLDPEATSAAPELIAALADREWAVRNSAAEALASMRIPGVASHLIPLLADPEPFVRRSIAYSLAGLEEATPVTRAALLDRLDDPEPDVRVAVLGALAKQPPRELDPASFLPALGDSFPAARAAAATILAGVLAAHPEGCGRALGPLGRLLGDADPWTRGEAIGAIGACAAASPGGASNRSSAAPIALLQRAFRDPDHSVRKHAVLAAEQLGPAAAPLVPELVRHLSGPEVYLRVWAAQALGAIGPAARAAVPALEAMRRRGYAELASSPEIEASQLPGAVDDAIWRIDPSRRPPAEAAAP